jgi:hypothetical protein
MPFVESGEGATGSECAALIPNEVVTSYGFHLAAAINGNTLAEFDEACPAAPPALSADEIEAYRAEVLVVGELDDAGDLKQMLNDMAASGV